MKLTVKKGSSVFENCLVTLFLGEFSKIKKTVLCRVGTVCIHF